MLMKDLARLICLLYQRHTSVYCYTIFSQRFRHWLWDPMKAFEHMSNKVQSLRESYKVWTAAKHVWC